MRRIVLVVEDSEQSAAPLEIALLSMPEIRVVVARCGREALRFLRGGEGAAVCAVVTDLQMPHMDGFELIGEIRADRAHARLPIIVLSGDTDPSTPSRILKLGADAYFSKPFSPAEVRKKLEQLLNASQA